MLETIVQTPGLFYLPAGMGTNRFYVVCYRNMYFKSRCGSDSYPEWFGLKVVQGQQYEPTAGYHYSSYKHHTKPCTYQPGERYTQNSLQHPDDCASVLV
jgi:hypothetical protein